MYKIIYISCVILLSLILTGLTSQAAPVPALNKERMAWVVGPVNDSLMEQTRPMFQMGQESTAPIDIIIDSTGGIVSHGLLFITLMEDLKQKDLD